MTVCIARKGYDEELERAYKAAKAEGACRGFVFINVRCKAISSTLIRTHLLRLRESACERVSASEEWTLKKESVGEKHKRRFRNGVRDMLHAEAVEYLIEHIAELWIVPRGNVVGGGQPHNVVTRSASAMAGKQGGK